MTPRSLPAAAALAVALLLAGCGGGSQTASTGSGAGSSAQTGNATDVDFLSGMKPHHEQAVEMSDIVLAAGVPAAVATVARQVKAAQAPEIQEIDRILAGLDAGDGSGAGGGHSGGHSGGHGGMLSEDDLAALKAARGAEAARLYLEGMIEHHQGAIEAAEAELAEGEHAPARDLATRIAKQQAAEIATMRALLAQL